MFSQYVHFIVKIHSRYVNACFGGHFLSTVIWAVLYNAVIVKKLIYSKYCFR
ncbi:hypothetical protein VAE151_630248 [Vibrio aestuarianus]|uniref:Uncharacterized protein n=1 Tax=Vibrio aestuarianus TaxID=28171 RepID=A0ABM9FHW1_9VIBR|nr:hypothetical protein VAE063_1000248 [Vibrio aestuarianus]CAH8217579.1 hypothetical protein VAE308_1150196 [Vibrio aestuarianus]CAH8222264.1 hypothetical protein VAE055_420250 [Vibrio aestuarianus]CAH8222288.1 hypothetical protein VAE032_320246 [Vibrio aestuarianus]CAH8222336.1 hypothetical protein VAE128_500243 [Vibrio aestuarianus]